MKVVILAGGRGTRISEESHARPKPMIEIGGMPVLWHIMKGYSYFGFNEFVICCGYKQDYIKNWFSNYFLYSSDVTFDYMHDSRMEIHHSNAEAWKVTLVDTGLNTYTGGRVKRIQEYVDDGDFMLTYGDGVCDVDISKLEAFHKSHDKLATITAVIKEQEKGILDINDIGLVRSFREKNSGDGQPINAGFMVLKPAIFNYIDGDDSSLERDVLEKLALEGQLMSYIHKGFWQCMDSMREMNLLELYWSKGNAPWKIW